MNIIKNFKNFFERKKDGTGPKLKAQRDVRDVVTIVALSSAVIAAGIFYGQALNKQEAPADPTPTEIVDLVETEDKSADEILEERFSLFADGIDIENLKVTDNLSSKTEQKAAEIAQAMNPEGTVYSPSEVTWRTDNATGEKEAWVSPEKADEWENNSGVTIGEGWLGPDGNVWENKEDYDNYINGNNEVGTVEYEDTLYWAEDGTPFLTAAERDAWNNHLKGNEPTVTGSNSGTTESQYDDTVYIATDGTPFFTEKERDEWNAHLKGQNTTTTTDTSTTTTDTEYEDTVYVADDGTPFYDKAQRDEWNAHLRGQNTAINNSSANVITDDAQYDDTVYTATDGTPFFTEKERDEWNNYLKGQNTTTTTDTSTTTTDTEYEDTVYVADDGTPFFDKDQRDEWNAHLRGQQVAATASTYIAEEDTTEVKVLTEAEYEEAESNITQAENNYTYNADGYIDNATGHFYDNDGDCWASYTDFLQYKQLLIEQEKSR